MENAFYTTSEHTFAKEKPTHVANLQGMLRKRQGANELTRKNMLEGKIFSAPQLKTLTSEMKIHFGKMREIKKASLWWILTDYFCCCRKFMHSYCRKVKKAGEHMRRDLDVINIISGIRENKVKTNALFSLD